MKTMNNKSSFVRHSYTNSRRMNSVRKASSPSDEESDSEEDERERRKYLSLKGGESFFWSANRLNKMISNSSKADCYNEINCNYFNDRTSSMSSFKRNVQARHSLKVYSRRPLHNTNLDLTERTVKSSNNSHHTFARALPLDDIQMNGEMEYGFNPLRVNNNHSSVRLRPLSICTPPREESNKIYRQNDSYFTLTKVNPRVISYASNDYEVELEKQLQHLKSQSCNLNFKGCQGDLSEKELKEDIAMSRRQRFIRRKLSFEYHPKKKWKKCVSLDSGLATEGFNPAILKPQLDASKSEELLNDTKDEKSKKDKSRKKKTKSVEFLEVDADIPNYEAVDNEFVTTAENTKIHSQKKSIDNSANISPDNTPNISPYNSPNISLDNSPQNSPINSPDKDVLEETFKSASAILNKISSDQISVVPAEEESGPTELCTTPVNDLLCTPVSSPVLDNDSSSEKQETPTKSSEKSKRLKASIPQIFSNFRLPNRSTFRKLIRRKTLDNSTPLKASHDIIRTELFSDKSSEFEDNDVVLLKSTPVSFQDTYEQITDTDTPKSNDVEESADQKDVSLVNNNSQVTTEDANTEEEKQPETPKKKEVPVVKVPCILDESVSMDSLNLYGKSSEKHTHKLIDKSISAYSLPRVDEGKFFIFCSLLYSGTNFLLLVSYLGFRSSKLKLH